MVNNAILLVSDATSRKEVYSSIIHFSAWMTSVEFLSTRFSRSSRSFRQLLRARSTNSTNLRENTDCKQYYLLQTKGGENVISLLQKLCSVSYQEDMSSFHSKFVEL